MPPQRSPSVLTAKSTKRFSLANSFRDLVDLFSPPSEPAPFDHRRHVAARPSSDSTRSLQLRKRAYGSASSGSSGTGSASSRNSGISFDSTSTAASSWAGSIHSCSDPSPAEGHWDGEGAHRVWVAPFASPFPPPSRPFRRQHSRSATFIESSIFAPNTFRFAATCTPDEEVLRDPPPPPPAPLAQVGEAMDEDTADDKAVQELQRSFARSGASHRRRGAISSASISVPAVRAIDLDIRIDNSHGAYDGFAATFMGLQLSGGQGKMEGKATTRMPSYGKGRASPYLKTEPFGA